MCWRCILGPAKVLYVAHLLCRLYQLTWQTPKGYSYNVDNFDDTRSFVTPLQDGWGAATDGKSLILSDGSSRLTWVEPTSFARERTVEVKDGKRVVRNLNEVRGAALLLSGHDSGQQAHRLLGWRGGCPHKHYPCVATWRSRVHGGRGAVRMR